MPEIAEVYTMAEMLNKKILDKKLVSITWYKKPGKRTHNCTFETYSELQKLLPLKIIKVKSHGKKIIIIFENNVYIMIAPLMTGSVIFKQGDYSHTVFNFGEKIKNINIVDLKVYFDDKLHQGLVNTYFDEKSYEVKMNQMGKDYIRDVITVEDYIKTLTNPKIKEKQICEFLMDQKYYAGAGNYLVAEILYASKIMPDRLLKNITEDELKELYNNTMRIIHLALITKGLTIKDYVTPDGEVGTFKTLVYNRSEDPLGNKVYRQVFKNKRTSHFVPEIQK